MYLHKQHQTHPLNQTSPQSKLPLSALKLLYINYVNNNKLCMQMTLPLGGGICCARLSCSPRRQRLPSPDHRQYPVSGFPGKGVSELIKEPELPSKGRGREQLSSQCLQKSPPHLGQVSECLVSKVLQNLSSGTEMLHPDKTSPSQNSHSISKGPLASLSSKPA